jgi:hypothetical protein
MEWEKSMITQLSSVGRWRPESTYMFRVDAHFGLPVLLYTPQNIVLQDHLFAGDFQII